MLTALFGLTLASLSRADTVVLLSGEAFSGELAKREEVRGAPASQLQIYLLPTDSDEIQRFRPDEIDHVILVDGAESTVIRFRDPDIGVLESGEDALSPGARTGFDWTGVPFMAIGGAALVTGAVVPFADHYQFIGNTRPTKEDGYNGVNFTLILLGGGLLSAGIRDRWSGEEPPPEEAAELSLSTGRSPITGSTGVLVALEF